VVCAILTIPGRAEYVATARRFVTAVLGGEHPEADTVALLTSELVTNSLLHSASGGADAHLLVVATGTAGSVRVEVTDAGGATIPALAETAPDAERGRGLALVDALATCWGTRRDAPGTVTWFEVAS
jgi:anti-sigma regulatory factor (Ser/Thr protein kinase)